MPAASGAGRPCGRVVAKDETHGSGYESQRGGNSQHQLHASCHNLTVSAAQRTRRSHGRTASACDDRSRACGLCVSNWHLIGAKTGTYTRPIDRADRSGEDATRVACFASGAPLAMRSSDRDSRFVCLPGGACPGGGRGRKEEIEAVLAQGRGLLHARIQGHLQGAEARRAARAPTGPAGRQRTRAAGARGQRRHRPHRLEPGRRGRRPRPAPLLPAEARGQGVRQPARLNRPGPAGSVQLAGVQRRHRRPADSRDRRRPHLPHAPVSEPRAETGHDRNRPHDYMYTSTDGARRSPGRRSSATASHREERLRSATAAHRPDLGHPHRRHLLPGDRSAGSYTSAASEPRRRTGPTAPTRAAWPRSAARRSRRTRTCPGKTYIRQFQARTSPTLALGRGRDERGGTEACLRAEPGRTWSNSPPSRDSIQVRPLEGGPDCRQRRHDQDGALRCP